MKQNGGENGMMKSRIMIFSLSPALSSVIKRRIIARSRLVARIVQTRKSRVIVIGNSKERHRLKHVG